MNSDNLGLRRQSAVPRRSRVKAGAAMALSGVRGGCERVMSSLRMKAMLKPSHCKHFAVALRSSNLAKRLGYGAFTAALTRMLPEWFGFRPSAFSRIMRFRISDFRLIICAMVCLYALAAIAQNSSRSEAHKDHAFTAIFRQTNHWAAGDVATSIPLSDGRVLWFFGDSYINQFDPVSGTLPCLFNARNSVLVQNTNDLLHPQTLAHFEATDKSFFRPPDAGTNDFWPCFWPAAGFQNGDKIYVYLSEMQKTPEGGMWGFKPIGQSWAKMSFPDLKVTGYVKLPSFNGIRFTCGFVADKPSGFTYAFGDKLQGPGSDVYVARFQTTNPEDHWIFWDGKGWSDNVTSSAIIAQGTSVSVNVCKVKNKFLLITTAFSVACDQGRDIFLMASDSPTGPFSQRQKIFSVDDTVDGHYPFFYLAVPHPEFISSEGLLITYCINGYAPCVPTCVKGRMNPDYYRPRAIRLPLK